MHPSHYGRMCPIETPEGPNIGLIGYLSCYARINRFGFIETPYRKVVERCRHRHDRVPRRRRRGPLRHRPGERGHRRRRPVHSTRRCSSGPAAARSRSSTPGEVDYMDVSPKQIVSIATALIPFLEHDDANRALMGANMQRQAVPMLRPEAPYIGTGVEGRAADDAGELDRRRGRRHGHRGDRRHDHGRRTSTSRGRSPTGSRSSAARTRAPASTRSRWWTPATRWSRATSSPTARRRTRASSRSARTCWSRSCPGRVTTSRTRSCSPSGSCATTCSPRSTSRSTRSTPATRSSAPRRSPATSRTSPRTS